LTHSLVVIPASKITYILDSCFLHGEFVVMGVHVMCEHAAHGSVLLGTRVVRSRLHHAEVTTKKVHQVPSIGCSKRPLAQFAHSCIYLHWDAQPRRSRVADNVAIIAACSQR